MPNGVKTTLRLLIHEDSFFNFRRWLKARDPIAELKYEPSGDDLWLLSVGISKRYLAGLAMRRWSAR